MIATHARQRASAVPCPGLLARSPLTGHAMRAAARTVSHRATSARYLCAGLSKIPPEHAQAYPYADESYRNGNGPGRAASSASCLGEDLVHRASSTTGGQHGC